MKKHFKKDASRRSDCPISCSLEVIGDKWSLLILRDIWLFGKSTYNEFLASEEGIATNMLRDRLARLTELGFITYTGADKRKKYSLTPLGEETKPIIEAIAKFGVSSFEGTDKYVEKHFRKKG